VREKKRGVNVAPKQKFTGMAGLPLARRALRLLKDRGIYAHSQLSVEHQQLAQRYVIRGLESGGCVGDVGRYVSFADEQGNSLEYLYPVETIGVNGLHAVVVSTALVRADMLRKGHTYELLITLHTLGSVTNGQRPQLESEILFRGIHGRLELDLTRKDKVQASSVVPTFYSLAGEVVAIPEKLLSLARATTKGVNCSGCSHAHYLRKPRPVAKPSLKDPANESATGAETTGTFGG
jgi:hypothetical protein